MQPWKISAGLTAAIAGSAVLLAGPRLEYLAPYWPLLLAEHGVLLALHLALAGQGAPPVRGRHSGRRARKLRGRARGHAPGEGRDHPLADGGRQGERLLR